MALALAPHGIRVNAVAPGTVETEMTTALLNEPAMRQSVLARTPIGRFGSVSDIAGVVGFLVSDEAAYMTGQTLFVDGGRMALNYSVLTPPGSCPATAR